MKTLTVLLLLSLTSNGWSKHYVLQYAHILYRHGARTPTHHYKTYTRQWPDGLGMLTQKGMMMEYELGEFLRNRYMKENKFLNTSYLHEEVYVRSSSSPRCLQSAETQLAGLYPPHGRQIWNPLILWQPIPVDTIEGDKDPLLRADSDDCPRRDEIIQAQYKTSVFKSKMSEHEELLKFIRQHTEMPIATGKEKRDIINNVGDTRLCEIAEGFTAPDWLSKTQEDELLKLFDWVSWFPYIGDNELGKIYGGVLLNSMVDNMQQFIKGVNKRKLTIFSAHDTTLSGLCTALDIHFEKFFPFAACILVELYKDTQGQYIVQLNYRNDSTRVTHPLKLQNCDFNCPFNKFVQEVTSRLATEAERSVICNLEKPQKAKISSQNWKNVALVFLVIVILLFLCLILLLRQYRKQKSYGKHTINPNDDEEDMLMT